MPRKPNEKAEHARELYKQGLALVKIAKELGVPEGTIRRWKSTYHWDNERSEKIANVRNEKTNAKNRKNEQEKVAEKWVIDSVMENSELSDKQRLFCCFYIKSFNATKAYQKAYGVDYSTAAAAGPRLLGNVRIKEEINCLKQNRLNREMLSAEDIFQKYMDIAFSDITDYVEFGRETVPVMGPFGPIQVKDEKTGKKIKLQKEINVVRFKECAEVDGTLISEVKQGKDGASIKLLDKMKALQWLSEHMDLATEEQKAKVEYLKARTDKLTGSSQEMEDMSDIEGDIYGESDC